MESDLECVVCYGVPKGKIFQCPNCHLLCEECRAKLDTFTAGKTLWSQVKCPKCRVFMGHDWIRNKWAEENVKKNVKIECHFEGCSVKILPVRKNKVF